MTDLLFCLIHGRVLPLPLSAGAHACTLFELYIVQLEHCVYHTAYSLSEQSAGVSTGTAVTSFAAD